MAIVTTSVDEVVKKYGPPSAPRTRFDRGNRQGPDTGVLPPPVVPAPPPAASMADLIAAYKAYHGGAGPGEIGPTAPTINFDPATRPDTLSEFADTEARTFSPGAHGYPLGGLESDIGHPVYEPRGALSQIASAGADFGRAAVRISAWPARAAATGIGELPVPKGRDVGPVHVPGLIASAVVPPWLGRGRGGYEQVKDTDPVTQFVAQSLPYVFAPEAGVALFAGSVPQSVQTAAQQYQAGDHRGAAVNLALTLGPIIAPELAKLGIKTAAGAARLAKTPRGQAIIADARLRLAAGEFGGEKLPGVGPEKPSLPGFEDVAPGEQPKIAVPEQKPGGDVPLDQRPALTLESPIAKGGKKSMPGMFADLPPISGGTTPPEYAVISPHSLDYDPRMQARAVAQGTTFDPRVVKQIVQNYDPALMTPIDVAPTPGKPGRYTVLGGMHRGPALQELGVDATVRVHNLDLTDPVQFKRAQGIADSSNLTQRDVSLKGTINAINRAGTTDVGELRAKYPRLNDQQITDAQHIGQLPGHVIDKLDALPASSPQIGIAAEVGRGAKVYGLTPDQAEGLLNRFTAGPRKSMLTRVEVRDAVDLFGPKMQESAQGAGMFGADVSNPIVDAMVEHARLAKEITKAKAQLARDIDGAIRVEGNENTAGIRRAKGELAALGAKLDQLDRGVLGDAGRALERPSASASSTSDAGANPLTSATEGTPSRGPQTPPATVSTIADPPSGSMTRNNLPDASLRGGMSTENIAPSIPGEPPATIPQIEGRSKPLSPEERAAQPRETDQAFFNPSTTAEVTDRAIKSDIDIYQRIQNLIQRVPGLKSVGTYIESIGAARGQGRLGNPIPLAMVKRDITVGRQSSEARAGLLGWAGGEHGQALGLNPNGIATAVEVRPGAKIPEGIAARLDDIIEHPEDYNLTPAQEAALVPVRHTLDAVTQHAQAAGVDVHEIGGPYFPRVITGAPKGVEAGTGGGIGNRLTAKPGFAKFRVFEDTRSAVAAGYKVASPFEALGDRLMSGVKATANKEAFRNILALGEKPSSRIPEGTTKALLDAREAYKAARASGDSAAIELTADALDAAKRALRKAGLRAATPAMGEGQAYGRIFPKPIMDELAKYGDVSGFGVVDEFFAVQRANEVGGDHSSLFVQGGTLLYRNPVAWLKSAAYSTASFAREPWGWVSRNTVAIEAAVKDGAAQPPSEFLLKSGGRISQRIGQLPVIKQTQRMFEWMVFMGQVEWHKGAVRMGMSAAERQELGAVIRKGMGSTSMPGVTNAMRNFDKRLWYAGGFMRATLGLMTDASRGGARGAEARKTLGMLVGGATAATIAIQYAVDGTMPNLTDPNNREKRWGYVEFPGGGVNLYGPLFPYMRLAAKAGQDLKMNDVGGAGSEATSLVSGKFALPIRTAIDLRRGETFMGEKIAPGWRGTLEYLAQQAEPIGIRQATEGALNDQLQQFPEQVLETGGLRTTPNSPYRLADNLARQYGVKDGLRGQPGDLAAAAKAHPDLQAALDTRATSQIESGSIGGQIKLAHADNLTAQQTRDDNFKSGALTLQQWKDARTVGNATLQGKIYTITGGKPYESGDKVLDGYYAIFRDPKYTAAGEVTDPQGLNNALDAYQSQHQAYLDKNTGLAETTPMVKLYRTAVKQIEASGYWKLADAATVRVTRGKYQTYRDAQRALTDPRGLALMKAVNGLVAKQKIAFLVRNPEIDALVSRWFGRKPRTARASSLTAETGARIPVAAR